MSKFLAFLLFSRLVFSSSELTYSTYLRAAFTPKAIALDSAGNIYLAGSAIVDTTKSQSTMLIVKLNPQGTEYRYVRYLGGSVRETANALAVDSAGNVYVAGVTTSPDFPVTVNGRFASAPSETSQRSFVVKLDAGGNVVFSDLLGGSAASTAQAIVVNSAGQILVTGTATSTGFLSTPGAYSVPDTTNRPYLLGLDPTGSSVAFSATGVGGSAIALDPAGNIYVAGTTQLLDYPTTQGVYQTQLPRSLICFQSPCSAAQQAQNQYVTKLDPRATTLLYSTGVTGTGNTVNGGLAVDAAGNAYLTGFAGAGYPYTMTPPGLSPIIGGIPGLPFLTKLDPLGQKFVFSIPVGGVGVQVDARGSIYVAGATGRYGSFSVRSTVAALSNVPSRCLPDNLVSFTAAYLTQVQGASGEILDTRFLGGSTLALTGSALRGSSLWVVGATSLPDFPFTANTITTPFFQAAPLPGAYLGAVEFDRAELAVISPRVACIVDAADMSPAGPMVPGQLLSAFGTNLGGTPGASRATTVAGGPTITFDADIAPVLYASDTQVNFAVPEIAGPRLTSVFRITRGVPGSSWSVPLGFAKPSVMFDFSQEPQSNNRFSRMAIALNADGSKNSADNPAALGSTISVFINGLQQGRQVAQPQLASINGWSVVNLTSANPYLLRADLRVPPALVNSFSCPSGTGLCFAGFTLVDVASSGSPPFGATVWVRR